MTMKTIINRKIEACQESILNMCKQLKSMSDNELAQEIATGKKCETIKQYKSELETLEDLRDAYEFFDAIS